MKIVKNNNKGFKESDQKVKYGFKQKFNKFWYKRKLLVEMIMLNGDKDFMVMQIDEHNNFKIKDRKYRVNPDELVYYKPFKLWGALYHEVLSIPIKQNVNIEECNDVIKKAGEDKPEILDAINNINPTTLNVYSDTKVIEDSIRGAGASSVFAFIKLMVILILIGVVIGLLMLNNIKPLF